MPMNDLLDRKIQCFSHCLLPELNGPCAISSRDLGQPLKLHVMSIINVYHMYIYRIAGKFGGELNLAVCL